MKLLKLLAAYLKFEWRARLAFDLLDLQTLLWQRRGAVRSAGPGPRPRLAAWGRCGRRAGAASPAAGLAARRASACV
jgi:hypothetical protein